MPLLDRTGAKPDAFVRDDARAEASIVPLDGLEAALAERRNAQRLGVDVPNTPVPDLAARVRDVDLVAIAFPKFSDGRGFSVAKRLREEGYRGTLRASGALIPDQFAFALQCGFDEVEIDDERLARQPVAQWLHALEQIGESYQEGSEASIFALRAAARQ